MRKGNTNNENKGKVRPEFENEGFDHKPIQI